MSHKAPKWKNCDLTQTLVLCIPRTEKPHCGTQYPASSGKEDKEKGRHEFKYDSG